MKLFFTLLSVSLHKNALIQLYLASKLVMNATISPCLLSSTYLFHAIHCIKPTVPTLGGSSTLKRLGIERR